MAHVYSEIDGPINFCAPETLTSLTKHACYSAVYNLTAMDKSKEERCS